MNRYVTLFAITCALILAGLILGEAQINVPYSFTAGTSIQSAQVNQNFTSIGGDALNRTGGTMTGTLTTQQVTPGTDATYDLGASSFKYRDFYMSRNATIGGTLGVTGVPTFTAQSVHNGGATFAGNLIATDNTYDIGASGATRFRDLFLARNATVGGTLGVTGVLTAPGVPVLLKANSGTDSSAGATNVDTIAITGLTAKDRLLVYCEVLASSQAMGGGALLYNSTDAVTLGFASKSLLANETSAGTTTVAQGQVGATTAISNHLGNSTTTGPRDDITVAAVATAWTGAWTLALRSAGIPAGGTMRWSWAVYKIPGQ